MSNLTKEEVEKKIEEMKNNKKWEYRNGNIVWINIPDEFKDLLSLQAGTRRGLIISNDVNNLFSNMIYIIPISSKDKKMKLHYKYKEQFILAEQCIPVNKEWIQIHSYIERLPEKDYKKVMKLHKQQFPFSYESC